MSEAVTPSVPVPVRHVAFSIVDHFARAMSGRGIDKIGFSTGRDRTGTDELVVYGLIQDVGALVGKEGAIAHQLGGLFAIAMRRRLRGTELPYMRLRFVTSPAVGPMVPEGVAWFTPSSCTPRGGDRG